MQRSHSMPPAGLCGVLCAGTSSGHSHHPNPRRITADPPLCYVDRRPKLFLCALILAIVLPLAIAPTARAQTLDPPPLLTKIDAAMAFTCGQRNITVFGQDLQAGATVKLSMAGQPDIVALQVDRGNLQDGKSFLRCFFDFPTGTAGGAWSMVVTNPDAQSGTLIGVLEVVSDCPRGAPGDLYVSNTRMWNILQFDGETGEFVCIFADLTTVFGQSDDGRPGDLIWAPNGNLWVTTQPPFQAPSVVLEFDGNTGAFLGFIVPLEEPFPSSANSLSFGGPNSDLYAQARESSTISFTRQYDRLTMDFFGIVLQPAPPMIRPLFGRFASNGNFLITGGTDGSPRPTFREYDGETFQILQEWVDNNEKTGFAETPDGCCYAVAERRLKRVDLYDIATLQFSGTLIPPPPVHDPPVNPSPCGSVEGGFAVIDPETCWETINQPYDLAYGPNGHLFVASFSTMVPEPSHITGNFSMGAIHEFDPITGQQVRVIGRQDSFGEISAEERDKLYLPVWLEFKPLPGDFSGSGTAFQGDWVIDDNDLQRFVAALLGTAPAYATAANLLSFDMDRNGTVDGGDISFFVQAMLP